MYKCNTCDGYFEEPIEGKMERDTGYIPFYCPLCDAEGDFTEADVCSCGEPIDSGEMFCKTCQDLIEDTLNEAMKSLDMDEDTFGDALVWYLER